MSGRRFGTPSRAAGRPRIVLFTPGLHELGGAARRSRLLAEGLAQCGYEVRVVSRSATTRRVVVHRDPGIVSVQVPGFGRRRLGAALYITCAVPLGLMWGGRARAYLALQIVAPTTAAAICGLLRRRPYIAFTSTVGPLSEVRAIMRSPFWGIRRVLITRATRLVAQTPEGADELERLVPRDRIAILPTPVRVPRRPPPLPDAPRVAYVGRLAEEKDLHTLLDAWLNVSRHRPESRLTIVGEGGTYRSEEASLRCRVGASAPLARSVTFAGWVDDVPGALAEHAVFVLPSRTEGMSNALLEACAAGRVVVASDIPGNRAVLGPDYPLFFPPSDGDALAECLLRALGDPGARREALAQVAARTAMFDVANVVARLREVIDTQDGAIAPQPARGRS